MTVRLFLTGERVGQQLARSTNKNLARVRAAEKGAASDVVKLVVPRVRANIAGAGNFGPRWTDGFQGIVTNKGNVQFTMKVPYWRIFQTGGVIRGKPLLWIPLSFASDAQGIRARDYPGRLFRVDRKNGGAPLLLAAGKPAMPKYFGKPSVKMPKKFRVIEIIREGAKRLPEFFRARMKASK